MMGEAESWRGKGGCQSNPDHKDNSFREFRRLCSDIAEVPGKFLPLHQRDPNDSYILGYLDKSALVRKWLSGGSSKDKFEGDMLLWVRLLLPGVVKRVYNMQSKQLVKVFSQIFGTKEEEMLDDLSEGDVAETIAKFYEQSKLVTPQKKSTLGLHEVHP